MWKKPTEFSIWNLQNNQRKNEVRDSFTLGDNTPRSTHPSESYMGSHV